MAEKTTYECKNCGGKVEADSSDANIPECCEKPMVKADSLPVCEVSTTAEHSRMDDLGDPCDDGRSG